MQQAMRRLQTLKASSISRRVNSKSQPADQRPLAVEHFLVKFDMLRLMQASKGGD